MNVWLLTDNRDREREREVYFFRDLMFIKLKKACGQDNISNKMLKLSSPYIIQALANVFNLILFSGDFPETWAEGLITPRYKQGDTVDPSNYRGICGITSTSWQKLWTAPAASRASLCTTLKSNACCMRTTWFCRGSPAQPGPAESVL